MKSEKGLTLLKFTVVCLVLALILGVTAYVALQENGPIDNYVRSKVSNSIQDNTVTNK